MQALEYSVKDGVATLLLNRPERKNAFTLPMLDDWAAVLRQAEADADVRVLVVTGAGDAFCSGVDLDAYAPAEDRTPWENKQVLTSRVHQVAHAMEAMTKPVIAAVRGVAYGAGMDMSLMCDMRIAGESARFSEAYIRLGLVPGDGGCWYLPRIVGMSNALHLLWTGEVVDAAGALRLGLVSAVHPDDELLDKTYDYARRLAAMSPIAVQLIKKAAYEGSRHDLRTGLDLISSHMGVVAATEDAREALQAFQQKRRPVFEGR
ncbi:enoyl-CoA hydratase/isomerase family protein [Streptomyces sp. NPDC055078]